jgi:hypothetical protein
MKASVAFSSAPPARLTFGEPSRPSAAAERVEHNPAATQRRARSIAAERRRRDIVGLKFHESADM